MGVHHEAEGRKRCSKRREADVFPSGACCVVRRHARRSACRGPYRQRSWRHGARHCGPGATTPRRSAYPSETSLRRRLGALRDGRRRCRSTVCPISVASSCLCNHRATTPTKNVNGSMLASMAARPTTSMAVEKRRRRRTSATSAAPMRARTSSAKRAKLGSQRAESLAARQRYGSTGAGPPSDCGLFVVVVRALQAGRGVVRRPERKRVARPKRHHEIRGRSTSLVAASERDGNHVDADTPTRGHRRGSHTAAKRAGSNTPHCLPTVRLSAGAARVLRSSCEVLAR